MRALSSQPSTVPHDDVHEGQTTVAQSLIVSNDKPQSHNDVAALDNQSQEPETETPTVKRPEYQIRREECISIPAEAHQLAQDADTYVSFGNNGTTATATASGKLLQITKYLGRGRSGFFSVDCADPAISDPWYVQDRAEDLERLSSGEVGISCEFLPELESLGGQKTSLEFIRDRWPQWVRNSEDMQDTLRYFVADGTIYSVWTCQWGAEPTYIPEDLSFDPNLFIRELDFSDPNHSFNDAPPTDDGYRSFLGPDGKSAILAHDFTSEDITLALVVTHFINRKRQELEEVELSVTGRPQFRLKLQDWSKATCANKRVELVTAYKLQFIEGASVQEWSAVSVPEYHSLEQDLAAAPYTRLTFSLDSHLDFIIRRNLEHILSVCSIPVFSGRKYGNEEDTNEPRERIALTCGDMSGHRIVNGASFFAFQFLLSILEYLKQLERDENDTATPRVRPDTSHNSIKMRRHLCKRIEDTCLGHLRWVFEQAERTGHCFVANYWASGEQITKPSLCDFLDAESLSDTPLQIIKLASFTAIAEGDLRVTMEKYAKAVLTELVHPWLKTLESADKRGAYAFPRPGTQKYRLDDHLWVWRALLSIENLGIGSLLRPKRARLVQRTGKTKGPGKDERGKPTNEALPSRDFSSSEIQRKVLKRFTTENIASRRRMIAVSRTSAETRFMFHSRDTALFYDTTPSFFNKTDSLWKLTIDAQKFHEENEDSVWDNPLRYAISLIMASKGYQINFKSSKDTFEESKRVLLRSSSPNGLFPGQLNQATKEPEMFDEPGWRDFYWHVTFEVPYILCKHGRIPPVVIDSSSAQKITRRGTDTKVVQMRQSNAEDAILNRITQAKNMPPVEEPITVRENLEMKKSMPFNSLIDQKSIVELPDEWLYVYPQFLDFDPTTHKYFATSIGLYGILDDFVEDFQRADFEMDEVIRHDIEEFRERQEPMKPWNFKDKYKRGIVLDVPKTALTRVKTKTRTASHKSIEYPEDRLDLCDCIQINEKLVKLRTAQEAKKRVIWSPNPDLDLILTCYLAVPDSEKMYLSAFFERHVGREKFFFDDATAALNLWRTELHLSFYQFLDEGEGPENKGLTFLGGTQKIERASIGFLFIGDFFDRYWTCHILEYDPLQDFRKEDFFTGEHAEEIAERFRELITPKGALPKTDLEKRPWRQRKVLELLIFDKLLGTVSRRYQDISLKICDHLIDMLPPGKKTVPTRKSVLAVSNTLFSSSMDNDTYLNFSKRWPPFEYTLQALEEDLKESLEKIMLWKNREKDREPERPRWTRNDERKYRSAINKLTTLNNQKVRAIQHHLTDIQSLRASLTSRLESTRNELSFQSAENVRFFTYVTVVFLPLGFATAIFSMNDTPMSSAVVGMVITSVIALFLTIVALVNAQRLDQKVFRPILKGCRALERQIFGAFLPTTSSKVSIGSSQDQRSSTQSFQKDGEEEKKSKHEESIWKNLFQRIQKMRLREGSDYNTSVVDEEAPNNFVPPSPSGVCLPSV